MYMYLGCVVWFVNTNKSRKCQKQTRYSKRVLLLLLLATSTVRLYMPNSSFYIHVLVCSSFLKQNVEIEVPGEVPYCTNTLSLLLGRQAGTQHLRMYCCLLQIFPNRNVLKIEQSRIIIINNNNNYYYQLFKQTYGSQLISNVLLLAISRYYVLLLLLLSLQNQEPGQCRALCNVKVRSCRILNL